MSQYEFSKKVDLKCYTFVYISLHEFTLVFQSLIIPDKGILITFPFVHLQQIFQMSHQHHHHHQHGHSHEHEHHHQHSHASQCPKIHGSDKKWQQTNPNYASIDAGPQTFFYTLTNMLKLNEAKNILEVGCGAGKLLSTVFDLKNPEASYYATDFSEAMVKTSKARLQAHFAKYESKLTYQEWLLKQKMFFDVQDGDNINVKYCPKFDRIIANMVLCHANDAQKMLSNWHSIATEDCLLGISLLGDPQKNKHVRLMQQSIQQSGQKLPETRPPYYWFDKISKLVEKCGWEIVLEWEQNALFPILEPENADLKKMVQKRLPEKARQCYHQKMNNLITGTKQGIQFWCKAIIARRKKTIV